MEIKTFKMAHPIWHLYKYVNDVIQLLIINFIMTEGKPGEGGGGH